MQKLLVIALELFIACQAYLHGDVFALCGLYLLAVRIFERDIDCDGIYDLFGCTYALLGGLYSFGLFDIRYGHCCILGEGALIGLCCDPDTRC